MDSAQPVSSRATGPPRSPAPALLAGLALTIVAVLGYAAYVSNQITALRRLQTEMTERNRRDSLRLLRVQNDLNQLGLAMRDMLDADARYPVTAWSSQFARIRADLDTALAVQPAEGTAASDADTADERQYLSRSLTQFWDAADRVFDVAAGGQGEQARQHVQLSLQARQSALSAAVARLLVQNNREAERVAAQTTQIYDEVGRQLLRLLAITIGTIAISSLVLIRSNRRLFGELAAASAAQQDLARTLISTRESTLRELARELHDEFGQLLTAAGTMPMRVHRRLPADSPLREDVREVSTVAQSALDNVRHLSQTLHPAVLEELGLDAAIDWYLSTVDRQLGLRVHYERRGPTAAVADSVGIQVYRVLQEALSNVARHAGTREAWVALDTTAARLVLTVEDAGPGVNPETAARGLGLVTMRERAALVGGGLVVQDRPGGGTRVRLDVPIRSVPAARADA